MPLEVDEISLLRQARVAGRQGRQAFAQLVFAQQGQVVRLVGYLLANVEDAEDVAQEAFEKAYHALRRGTPVDNFGAWMRRIATNTAFNHKRSQKRRRARRELMMRLRTTPARGMPVVQKDLADYVMSQLSYAEREILVLKHVEEMSIAEIGAVLKVSPSAVKMRLKRAREHFITIHDGTTDGHG